MTRRPVAEDGHTFVAPADATRFATPYTPRSGESNLRFFGSGVRGDMTPGPVAFLAHIDEDIEVDSHFHNVDQFQLLFGGSDSYYQSRQMPKTLLQYSDAYTVYGPFGARSQEPMDYFTLRGAPSNVHGTMPGARDKLLYRGRRRQFLTLDPFLRGGDDPRSGEVMTDTLFSDDTDGLASYLVRFGPQAEFSPPEGELRTGRYTVVLKGEMRYDGRAFGPRSVGWSTGDAPQVTVQGGTKGAVVLFLYMPFPATPTVRLAELSNQSQQSQIRRQ
jgi:hypothetical protein